MVAGASGSTAVRFRTARQGTRRQTPRTNSESDFEQGGNKAVDSADVRIRTTGGGDPGRLAIPKPRVAFPRDPTRFPPQPGRGRYPTARRRDELASRARP